MQGTVPTPALSTGCVSLFGGGADASTVSLLRGPLYALAAAATILAAPERPPDGAAERGAMSPCLAGESLCESDLLAGLDATTQAAALGVLTRTPMERWPAGMSSPLRARTSGLVLVSAGRLEFLGTTAEGCSVVLAQAGVGGILTCPRGAVHAGGTSVPIPRWSAGEGVPAPTASAPRPPARRRVRREGHA